MRLRRTWLAVALAVVLMFMTGAVLHASAGTIAAGAAKAGTADYIVCC